MSAGLRSLWHRGRFWLSGLVLLLSAHYLYQSLNPQFPPEWQEQTLGDISAAPMPFDEDPPYRYDGKRYKDFAVRFCDGCMARLRTAHLSIGSQPAERTPPSGDGVLHGSLWYAEAHAPFPEIVGADDRLWLTVQTWDGRLQHVSWPLPAAWR